LLPDASTKFQENVSGGTTTSSEGVQSSSANSEGNQGAAHTAKSSNSTAEGAGESSAQTGESFAAAAGKTVYTTVSQGLQTATASAHAAFQKVREAKVVDSIKTSYSFLREELSNTRPRRKARAAPDTGPPPAENTEVTAVVPVVKKTTGWEKRWETLKEKVLRKKLYASHHLSFLGCFSGPSFWEDYYMLIYTHCWELMNSVGSHGSLSLLFLMKVMVCHFVSGSHEVMTALIVMLPLIVVVEICLQLHRCRFSGLLFLILHFSEIYLMFVSCLM
jgi:hypothetical protein